MEMMRVSITGGGEAQGQRQPNARVCNAYPLLSTKMLILYTTPTYVWYVYKITRVLVQNKLIL